MEPQDYTPEQSAELVADFEAFKAERAKRDGAIARVEVLEAELLALRAELEAQKQRYFRLLEQAQADESRAVAAEARAEAAEAQLAEVRAVLKEMDLDENTQRPSYVWASRLRHVLEKKP